MNKLFIFIIYMYITLIKKKKKRITNLVGLHDVTSKGGPHILILLRCVQLDSGTLLMWHSEDP